MNNKTNKQQDATERVPVDAGEVFSVARVSSEQEERERAPYCGGSESGHQHVLQARLKIPGAWWREDNAHAMPRLRVCRVDGLWPQPWQI